MKTVIFACVHNAGRSQMAAAFFNDLASPQHARAVSAGTQPGVHVHPEVVQAMREVGIDLSAARPQLLTEELASSADVLVTMGCAGKTALSCPASAVRTGRCPILRDNRLSASERSAMKSGRGSGS